MARFLTQLVAVATSAATVAATLAACGAARSPAPLSATASTAPASSTAPPAPATHAAVDTTLHITDATLTGALENAIGGDAVLASQHVHVSVQEGVVSLNGSVSSLAAKRRAARLVEGFRGPRDLYNQLVVDAPPRPDADIAQDVRQVLQYDQATRRAKVQVEVDRGLVTLRGSSASRHERALLLASAARVRGVKDVVLAFASPRSPAVEDRVAREVDRRLADDARVEGLPVKVHVAGRSVELSGTVGSLAQREAAVEDARVDGVDEVRALGLQVDWRAADQARARLTWSAPADSVLADAVRRDLGSDARIGFPLPTVTVAQGVVTLSGKVNDYRSESAAKNDAGSVRGVLRVDAAMTVAPGQRESDAVIQHEVERTVLNDLEAPDAPHLQMTTAGAKVTLRGNVVSAQEKSLIDSDVEAVPGVIDVQDDLQVQGESATTQAAPSESLRTRIIERIFWDSRVDSGHVTTAVTASGDATLSGQVYSPREARAAVEDATAAGALHVTDDLRIAGR